MSLTSSKFTSPRDSYLEESGTLGPALGCQSVDPASPVADGPVEDPCHGAKPAKRLR